MSRYFGQHSWLMAVCLLVPAAALVAIFAFGVPTGSVLALGLLLICPLMHLLMMRGHAHQGHQGHAPLRQAPPAASRGDPARD